MHKKFKKLKLVFEFKSKIKFGSYQLYPIIKNNKTTYNLAIIIRFLLIFQFSTAHFIAVMTSQI